MFSQPSQPTPTKRPDRNNPYHLLTVSSYKFFVIIGFAILGIGALAILAGILCPFWNTTGDLKWGVFFCYQSNFAACGSQVTFTVSTSKTIYTVSQALSGLATGLGFGSMGLVVFLFIRMRRSALFDKLQRLLTIIALVIGIVGAAAGFTALVLVYYKIANDEKLTFSPTNAACGITFGAGCILLCLGLIFVILLLLYRRIQQEKVDESPPQEPPQLPAQRPGQQQMFIQWPKPADQPRALVGPPQQIFRQPGPIPDNPYGYTGEPYHDAQMHWLHSWYHHFAYNRPTYPFMAPANTVPPREDHEYTQITI